MFSSSSSLSSVRHAPTMRPQHESPNRSITGFIDYIPQILVLSPQILLYIVHPSLCLSSSCSLHMAVQSCGWNVQLVDLISEVPDLRSIRQDSAEVNYCIYVNNKFNYQQRCDHKYAEMS